MTTVCLLITCIFLLLIISVNGCTTSCGNLNRISFPFRVRGDPKHCGDSWYELACEGGEASFCMAGHNYLVTNISMEDKYASRGTVTVHVDCPFTTNTCRLNHTCDDDFSNLGPSTWENWASFISCSQKFDDNEKMLPFSLLDDVKTNTHGYVVLGNMIFDLNVSCKFVDTFLFPFGFVNSSVQVIETLQNGMNIDWYDDGESGTTQDRNCWAYAIRTANQNLEYDYHISRFYALASNPFNFVVYFLSCKACSAKATDDGGYKCHTKFENIVSGVIKVAAVSVGLAFACRILFGPLTVCAYLMHNYWKNTRSEDSVEVFLQKQQVLQPRRYNYSEITIMTNNFKEKIGKGGFGQVYKGELFSGYPVAVKVLSGLKFNGEEFINEVSTIGRIHHINIVQLVGFCSDGTKRALIYEYMSNGSLDKYIFSSKKNMSTFPLSVEKLKDIALGIAKGINYLHTGCDMQILHFDIKPHNILLDENFVPKISDFGLAKLYPKEQGLLSVSVARGTVGYIAPELISRSFGVISPKADVYSFGMLILEIAGRRRNVDTEAENSKEIYYPSWIFDQLTQLEASSVNEIIVIGEVERQLCKLGLWCIQMNPLHRPTMSEVIKILESTEDEIKMPPKPFSFSTDTTIETYSTHNSLTSLSIIVEEN